jgi:NADH-quinone oxidoreductase subunit J
LLGHSFPTRRSSDLFLVGRYVLPLEIVALLLTAATIGAVIVAIHEKDGAQ